MIQYHFICELISDVIISSASATEGSHPSLDYIPGAKFWGIAAKELYDVSATTQTLDLFHNGRVRFGDAHLLINDKRSLKLPLSWFKDKHQRNTGAYVHHAVDYEKLVSSGVQPEQWGNDYFNEEGSYAKPAQDFSIKSAYDRNKRRSEDEKMYGYYALPAGSRWAFTVASEDEALLEKIKGAICGRKRIGRSRSAQYGLGEISFKSKISVEKETIGAGRHYLYADSALMLPLDIPLSEALAGAKIDFEKSKIRTRIYQSWNTERHTRDADRQIIEKGSVIAFDLSQPTDADVLLQNLRERRVEGFGDILVNPPFLMKLRDGQFAALNLSAAKENATNQNRYLSTGNADKNLLEILKNRQSLHQKVVTIDDAVNQFVTNPTNKKRFAAVTASQWGTIRSLAKLFPKKEDLHRELFNSAGERKGYLVSGIAEEKWRAGKDTIAEIVNGGGDYPHPRHQFLEKLAAEMAKQKREKES